MRSRGIFVVFEGLDGTGKTTVARRTAELIGARYMTTPSAAVRRFREELVESFGGSQEAAQLFYMSTVFAASEEARALIHAGESVVIDRYFLSTQAYAEFRGSSIALDALHASLLPADLTVFLEASLSARAARILARGASATDRETLNADAQRLLTELYVAKSVFPIVGRFLRLDTSLADAERVAAQVAAQIVATEVDARDPLVASLEWARLLSS